MKRWTNEKKPELVKLWNYCESKQRKACEKDKGCNNTDAIGFACAKQAEKDLDKCRPVEGKLKLGRRNG